MSGVGIYFQEIGYNGFPLIDPFAYCILGILTLNLLQQSKSVIVSSGSDCA